HFSELAIFVDQPRSAPTQVIFHLVACRQWEGSDAHFQRTNRFERLCQSASDDIDRAGCKAALRHEGRFPSICQHTYEPRCFNILCEIEIRAPRVRTDICDQSIQIVGSCAHNGVAALNEVLQGVCRPDINLLKSDLPQSIEVINDSRVAENDFLYKFGDLKKRRNRDPDLAGTKNSYFYRHTLWPFSPLPGALSPYVSSLSSKLM